jgi:polyisoprenoid-binding protein YceI
MNANTEVRHEIGVQAPPAGTWKIDPGHSSITITARHLMVSKVRGNLTDFEGTIHVGERSQDSWVEVSIEAASVNTANPQRDEHMRSPDFLDVENFPKIEFRSTKTELAGANTLRVSGDLTVRGITKPVVLDVEYLGLSIDPFGNNKSHFAATTELDREEWGMTWNMALETGGVLVGKKLQVELDVQAVHQKEG